MAKNFSKYVPNGNNGDCVKIKAGCYTGRKKKVVLALVSYSLLFGITGMLLANNLADSHLLKVIASQPAESPKRKEEYLLPS